MDYRDLFRRLGIRMGQLAQRARAVTPSAPILARKPAIALHSLLCARAAQLVLIGATLAMLFVIGPLVASSVEKAMPENRALFGLVKKRDSRAQQIQSVINWTFWVATGGTVLLLWWLHIPAAIEQAGARARRKEEKGDRLKDERPQESLACYRQALALASDAEVEARLGGKIAGLVRRLLPEASPAETGAAGTVAGTRVSKSRVAAGRFADTQSRYEIRAELGAGNKGVVFDATDHVLDRRVALKQLPAWLAREADFVVRFQQEARALARLSHPHIVQVYDFFEAHGRLFMVLEHVAGGDLACKIEREQALDVATAAGLGVKMAGALGYAHYQGVVHRDFKPANVLLTEAGSPKVTDFGLAKIARSSTLTQDGAVLGSPLYMSPEQAAGRPADARSDIYALGITMYQLLTGRTPFCGDTAEVLAQHITQAPPPPRTFEPGIPPSLDRLISDMLAKDPAMRPGDMHTVARALAGFTTPSHAVA
jgi:hypothetical protein